MIRPLRRPRDYYGRPVYGPALWISQDDRFAFFRWTSNPDSPYHAERPPSAPTSWWTVGSWKNGDADLLNRVGLANQWFARLQDAIDALEVSMTLEASA